MSPASKLCVNAVMLSPFACHSEPFACHSEPFACHSEPFACHSERSEESPQFAQGKLCEESPQLAQGKLREESPQFAAGYRSQKRTAEILRPPKSGGLRMTGLWTSEEGARATRNGYDFLRVK